MPVAAAVILCVTIVLLGLSAATQKRVREMRKARRPVIEPAPWEREARNDLTAPVAALVQEPTTQETPAGARVRRPEEARIQAAMMDDVLKGLQQIPPLPTALMQIIRELDNAGSSARSISEIVATEPVLTATLLRVVNSAAVGLRREVVTVADAVTYLGFSTVKALFLRLKLGALFPSHPAGGGYDAQELWVHSMAVAQVAEHLARRVGGLDPQLASTVGMLHDIGKVAINSQFPGAVTRLWEPGGAADESFLGRERRLFGADHAFIGGYLAARWALPEDLVEAIRLHHLPAGESIPLRTELRRALIVVHLANQLVKYCHVYCADMEIDIVAPELMRELNLPEELEELLDDNVVRIVRRAAQLGHDSGTESKPEQQARAVTK